MRNEWTILVGEPRGKRLIGIRWSGWGDNIKRDHMQIKADHK
jgi:hypothetical protein